VNPKRTDDAREQGAEVIPARPPKRSDKLLDQQQAFDRLDRVDQQAFVTWVYRRWPEYIRNAVEEEREPEVVFQ
jgi:predicted CoA-binding protein